jgi:short-subunit dehydrogenase
MATPPDPLELAPFGIGVSVLCPGPVRTKIIANTRAQEPPRESITPDERQRERELAAVADRILQGGTPPDDVGRMVVAGVKENRLYIHTDRCDRFAAVSQPSRARSAPAKCAFTVREHLARRLHFTRRVIWARRFLSTVTQRPKCPPYAASRRSASC